MHIWLVICWNQWFACSEWVDAESKVGFKHSLGKGPCLIIVHVRGVAGWISKPDLVFRAKHKIGDYHSEMNAEQILELVWERDSSAHTFPWLLDSNGQCILPQHIQRISPRTLESQKWRNDSQITGSHMMTLIWRWISWRNTRMPSPLNSLKPVSSLIHLYTKF